jgi:hypothetical protein
MDGIAREVPALEKMLSNIGPGNIVAAVSQSQAIETTMSGAVSRIGPDIASSAFSAPSSGDAGRGAIAAVIDHDALVRAMQAAGVAETYLDGELVSRQQSRVVGRTTRQRGRTG